MPFSPCLQCPKLGKGCDGPNLFSLTATEVLEWCKARKNDMGLSNTQLAKLSGIPDGTVSYVLSPNRTDFKFETMRPIVQVLIGGKFHGHPCPDPNGDAAAKIEELIKKNEGLHRVIKGNKDAYDADLERERSDADRRVNYLKQQLKERKIVIAILSVSLAITLLTIIIALLIDRSNPNMGFFWLEDSEAAANAVMPGILNILNLLWR